MTRRESDRRDHIRLERRQVLRIAGVALGIVLCLSAGVALASEIDDAKRAGTVGEQVDGYLGAVVPSAQPLVDEINRKRRAEYAKIARENDIPVEQVAALAGRKLVRRTPTGQLVRGADGNWVQK